MKFFFPDNMDLVDPSYDFDLEARAENHINHQDDLYAHEVLSSAPYDGILVSKSAVDGFNSNVGLFSQTQRQRFYREGVKRFFRLNRVITSPPIATMGDCGAYSYVREIEPPYELEDVFQFYDSCGFDYGISMDHIIRGFFSPGTNLLRHNSQINIYKTRQEMTLQYAAQFWHLYSNQKPRFEPVGVAQGWNTDSYNQSFNTLQQIGYQKIAIGGISGLNTQDIITILSAINNIRNVGTQIHLCGVTRIHQLETFSKLGVCSFDSTSPFLRAFKDGRKNYFTPDSSYTAIHVPQLGINLKLKRRVASGQIDPDELRRLEPQVMHTLMAYDKGEVSITQAIDSILTYNRACNSKPESSDKYRHILESKPWKRCLCEICRSIGIHVVIFRGSERNRRRGFHNLYLFKQNLDDQINAMLN